MFSNPLGPAWAEGGGVYGPSWLQYCEWLLASGHVGAAAIGGLDGETWGKSNGFKVFLFLICIPTMTL